MKGLRTSLISMFLVAGLALPMLTTAQSSPAQTDADSRNGSRTSLGLTQSPFQERTPRYRLRPGDVFDLNFEFNPEFNQTVSVQPDGFVTLKGVGDIHVAGKTVPEATQLLTSAYAKFISQPNLILVLKDFEKPYFTAAGQLARPGKYELRGDTTVSEGISIAGGFLESSKHSQVILFRKVSDQWMEAKELDMKKMLASKDLREDIVLRPGDMIWVPQNRISKFRRLLPINPGVVFNPAQTF